MGQSSKNNAISYATAEGNNLERMLSLQTGGVFGGLISLFNLAAELFPPPRWTTGFSFFFNIFTSKGTQGQPFYSLEALPKGVISSMLISDPAAVNFTAAEMADYQKTYFYKGQNILNPNNRPSFWPSWSSDVSTINSLGQMSLLGPNILAPGLENKGQFMTLRMPLFFLDDGLWGLPDYSTTVCPSSVCNLADGRSFMGFIQSKFDWKPFVDSLNKLQKDHGLRYSLLALDSAQGSNTRRRLASSDPQPDENDSVCIPITVLDWINWELCVYEPSGWIPQWTGALYAVFSILSLAISILLFLVLRSRAQAFIYLAKQKEMNRQLEVDKAIIEANKEELEALTVRQFELLKHFADKKGKGKALDPQESQASSQAANFDGKSISHLFRPHLCDYCFLCRDDKEHQATTCLCGCC